MSREYVTRYVDPVIEIGLDRDRRIVTSSPTGAEERSWIDLIVHFEWFLGLQILSFLSATCIAWCGAVLIGHNGGHGNYYPDYSGYDGFAAANEYLSHRVLPTVAVPVHSVSAAPFHASISEAAPGHELYHVHGPEHQELHHAHALEHHGEHHGHHGGGDDHDYYVSIIVVQLDIDRSTHTWKRILCVSLIIMCQKVSTDPWKSEREIIIGHAFVTLVIGTRSCQKKATTRFHSNRNKILFNRDQ